MTHWYIFIFFVVNGDMKLEIDFDEGNGPIIEGNTIRWKCGKYEYCFSGTFFATTDSGLAKKISQKLKDPTS